MASTPAMKRHIARKAKSDSNKAAERAMRKRSAPPLSADEPPMPQMGNDTDQGEEQDDEGDEGDEGEAGED